ncbi:MAG TPA: CBS and ACT domain-containing protein [Thermoanaerobaculia bacterium]|nr:CBS and ACT domain-containing protein [Thermoanaerobaculia bacterium]
MFVGKRMTREVFTVSRGDTLKFASDLLRKHRIHQLPVVEGGELVGFLSGTDIRNSTFEERTVAENGEIVVKNKTVEEIMTREVITVAPWDTVEDAVLIFSRRRLGALPVVEGTKLVGIITKADVLAAFCDTLRIEEAGVRIEVLLPRDVGSLIQLVRKLGEMRIEIRSLILSPSREGFVAFVRLATIDVAAVKKTLGDAGFSVPELSDFLE